MTEIQTERTNMARPLFVIIAALLLAACLQGQPTWYEERCLRLGFAKGSKGFNDCVERDLRWIKDNDRRFRGEGGQ